jgi:hypothetical protein
MSRKTESSADIMDDDVMKLLRNNGDVEKLEVGFVFLN